MQAKLVLSEAGKLSERTKSEANPNEAEKPLSRSQNALESEIQSLPFLTNREGFQGFVHPTSSTAVCSVLYKTLPLLDIQRRWLYIWLYLAN